MTCHGFQLSTIFRTRHSERSSSCRLSNEFVSVCFQTSLAAPVLPVILIRSRPAGPSKHTRSHNTVGSGRCHMRRQQAIEAELHRFRQTHPPPVQGASWEMRDLLNRIHNELFDPVLNVQILKTRCRISDHNVSCRFKHELLAYNGLYAELFGMQAAGYRWLLVMRFQGPLQPGELSGTVHHAHHRIIPFGVPEPDRSARRVGLAGNWRRERLQRAAPPSRRMPSDRSGSPRRAGCRGIA